MLLLNSDDTQIIMVSYFRPNDFQKSVESVLNNTTCPFHLSIIDNSQGNLDFRLNEYEKEKRVTIYRNTPNIGKGAAFNLWYKEIIKHCSLDHFISIDSDIVVPRGWLMQLKRSHIAISKREHFGIIAPVICNRPENTFAAQLSSGNFDMHRYDDLNHVEYLTVYRNRYTAGPLFLIDRTLFEKVGYYDGQLYGADDGRLCAAAARQNRFIGIDTSVEVLHMNDDETTGYREWKLRNITTDVDQHGHWD